MNLYEGIHFKINVKIIKYCSEIKLLPDVLNLHTLINSHKYFFVIFSLNIY